MLCIECNLVVYWQYTLKKRIMGSFLRWIFPDSLKPSNSVTQGSIIIRVPISAVMDVLSNCMRTAIGGSLCCCLLIATKTRSFKGLHYSYRSFTKLWLTFIFLRYIARERLPCLMLLIIPPVRLESLGISSGFRVCPYVCIL